MGLEIGIGDLELRYWIRIGDWDWGLEFWIGDWRLEIGIGDWDLGLGIGIGDWDWRLVVTFGCDFWF